MSLQHGLATYLNCLLEPVLQYYLRYTVKESFRFVNEMQYIHTKYAHMTSFDITNLFNNVPLKKFIQICVDMVYQWSSRGDLGHPTRV